MNTEHFEERLMRQLKDHVQQRAASPQSDSAAAAAGPRRRLGMRLALPAGLATAAAAGIALAVLPTQAAAAYTLQQQDGLVKLAITNPAGTINLGLLQQELQRLGVYSRVLVSEPTCTVPPPGDQPAVRQTGSSTTEGVVDPAQGPRNAPSSANFFTDLNDHVAHEMVNQDGFIIGSEKGRDILYIDPGKLADDELVIAFPRAEMNLSQPYAEMMVWVDDGHGPACQPRPIFGATPSLAAGSH